ncbi:MAG: hypothetical protein ABL995_14125 [Bryobacteraceae bacterium]
MDKYKKATTDLIAALSAHEAIHAETVKAKDAASKQRYKDSYDRVRDARKHWKQLFQPSSFRK